MIAMVLPMAIRLLVLAVVGACAGALANCILFACSNVVKLTNPWAPLPPGGDSPDDQAFPPRDTLDRVPIFGWWRLRREAPKRGCCFWVGPMLLEVACAIVLPLFYWFESRPVGLLATWVDAWMALPLQARYGLLAAGGLLSGAFANYLIYTQAHDPRPIDPWAPAAEDAPPRKWSDRIPVFGWLGLRREAAIHGRGFWVRPILIEITLASAIPALYWFETQAGGLFPVLARAPGLLTVFEPWMTDVFLGHAILLVLMAAATFIDFDEKTIPDIITIPGTVIALLLASITIPVGVATMNGFPPTALPVCQQVQEVLPTTFDSPWFAPFATSKWVGDTGLFVGLAIWTMWCFALADRRFSGVMLRRRGLTKTIGFFFAALVHHWTWKLLIVFWIAGVTFVTTIWAIGGPSWHGLLTALVGLAVGGGTIWAIRIVASGAMKMEAMGFGDVTLMAMIGAFIGWQGAIAAFFFSPFTAIVIVVVRYIITRDQHVPFGPYLCAGALLTILFWDRVYNDWLACNLNMMGPMALWLAIVMLGLMGVMLFISRMIKSMVFRQ